MKLEARKVQSKFEPFDVAGWSKLQKPFWYPMKQKNYFNFGYSANSAQIMSPESKKFFQYMVLFLEPWETKQA